MNNTIFEKTKFPFILAPMAGVTDVGFRAVCSSFGADATVTEMLSVRAMAFNPKKTEFMTLTSKEEKYKIAQIFGHEENYFEKAVKNKILQKFDAFDINMGCPAPKIIKNGEGGALMDNLILASKLISTTKNSTNKPVSVKFRKGNKLENYLEFARMCQDSGADYITFHARTVSQGYSGKVDLDAIATLKAKVNIKVIGNGDVIDESSLKSMENTFVDGVMIGRGSLGRPWIFAKLMKKEEKMGHFDAIYTHISYLRKYFDENWLKLYIRKHLLWYAKDLPLSNSVRAKLSMCDDIDVALGILKDFLNS